LDRGRLDITGKYLNDRTINLDAWAAVIPVRMHLAAAFAPGTGAVGPLVTRVCDSSTDRLNVYTSKSPVVPGKQSF
jgi:hypothetical protein